jgi:hypothetical protein
MSVMQNVMAEVSVRVSRSGGCEPPVSVNPGTRHFPGAQKIKKDQGLRDYGIHHFFGFPDGKYFRIVFPVNISRSSISRRAFLN